MVGAGRFERPTPCAQGSFRPQSKMPYFQLLTFQADGANLLQLVEPCGTRRLSPATILSTLGFSPPCRCARFAGRSSEPRAADFCACSHAVHHENRPGQTIGEAPAPAAAGPRRVLNS